MQNGGSKYVPPALRGGEGSGNKEDRDGYDDRNDNRRGGYDRRGGGGYDDRRGGGGYDDRRGGGGYGGGYDDRRGGGGYVFNVFVIVVVFFISIFMLI